MNKLQIQISQIDNGWIVASGGIASKLRGGVLEPSAVHCKNAAEIKEEVGRLVNMADNAE